MNRREMLMSSVAALAVAATGKVMADDMSKMHDMGDMHEHQHEMSTRNTALITAASDCVLKANICLQHCIVLMGKGDKDLAACAKSSSQVSTICAALQQLASGESKFLPQLAKVAMDICKDCEEECKKTDKHPECKACGEACAACYKECKKIAA